MEEPDVNTTPRASPFWMIAAALVLLLLLGACATRLEPIKAGDEISVVLKPPARGSAESIDIANKNVGKDSSIGWVGGSFVGAAAALACGPFWVICVGPSVVAFGTTGAVAGALAGVAQGLPADVHGQLREIATAYSRENKPMELLTSEIRGKAAARWILVPEGRDAKSVTLDVRELSLHVLEDDRVSLALVVEVGVHDPRLTRKEQQVPKLFAYIGPAAPVQVWLDGGGRFMGENFAMASKIVTHRIYADLTR